MERLISESDLRRQLKSDESYRHKYVKANYFGILKGHRAALVDDYVLEKKRHEDYKNNHYSIVNNAIIAAFCGLAPIAVIFSGLSDSDLNGAGLFIAYSFSFFIVTMYTKSKMMGHEDVTSSARMITLRGTILADFDKEFNKEMVTSDYYNSQSVENLYQGFLCDAIIHIREFLGH